MGNMREQTRYLLIEIIISHSNEIGWRHSRLTDGAVRVDQGAFPDHAQADNWNAFGWTRHWRSPLVNIYFGITVLLTAYKYIIFTYICI